MTSLPWRILVDLSTQVKYFRNLLRLPQTYVADRLQISRPTYTKMEHGKADFSAAHLVSLANLFRIDIGDFFKPSRADYLETLPVKTSGQFRLSEEEFRMDGRETKSALTPSINELLLWSKDDNNQKFLRERIAKADKTHGKFKNVNEAIQYCRGLSSYTSGNAIDIFNLVMLEFGLWISWNSFKNMSGVYLGTDKEVIVDTYLPIPLIGINSDHPTVRQRFSVAHELAHHLFGQRGKIGSPTKPNSDSDELEANQFASELLMDPAKVESVFAFNNQAYRSKLELPSIILLSANLLQVSYSALVKRLLSLGLIPGNKQEELSEAKVRDLQRGLSKAKKQNFETGIIKKCELSLKPHFFYKTDLKTGAPARPEDIRFLQDYSYVEYLHLCQTKPPVESGIVFQEVVSYVANNYPTYH